MISASPQSSSRPLSTPSSFKVSAPLGDTSSKNTKLTSSIGVFYLIVPAKTLIDWWIITRETAFILVYLIVISACLYGNKVEIYKALILFLLYIIHIFAMKFSSKYEVAIK